MDIDPDAIAAAVISEFEKLPSKRKPHIRSNGVHEWVPLSGIVARDSQDGSLKCVALATGMKCLPASKVSSSRGRVLHDWHAEVLCMRAFNVFLLEECKAVASGSGTSRYVRRRAVPSVQGDPHSADGETTTQPWCGQPFEWNDDISLHMYTSDAPCGDASMELTMASQADPTPWELPTPSPAVAPDTSPSSSSPQTRLVGREFFSLLGVVRRKPARGDAPQTLSKSCSDKLALRQVSSLLAGGGPSLLVATSPGLYLASVVMPASQVGDGVGCTRAFSGKGRMKAIEGRVWSGSGPLAFRPFVVRACSDHVDDSSGPVTSSEGNMLTPCYRFSRSAVAARAARAGAVAIAPSNLSVAWTATGLEEALTGGTVDGRRAAVDVKAAGKTSRLGLWRLAVEVAALLDKESSASGGDEDDRHSPGPGGLDGGLRRWLLEARTYGEVKKCPLLKARREVLDEVKRTALQGWIPNERDEDFGRE